MAAPVVGAMTPDPSAGPIDPQAAIGFTVTDASALFRDLLVLVAFAGTNLYEVVWDGSAFAPFYNAQSTIAPITNGFQFSLRRAGGWAGGPVITVHAIDVAGAENP
jgi:hypothetical protein